MKKNSRNIDNFYTPINSQSYFINHQFFFLLTGSAKTRVEGQIKLDTEEKRLKKKKLTFHWKDIT